MRLCRNTKNFFALLKSNIQKRTFMTLPKTNQEYHGRKLVGFSCEQMFNVITDVESYERFLPFCKESRILVRRPNYIKSSLIIGFPPVIESYTSYVHCTEPNYVKVECKEGKLLKHLLTTWTFTPALKSNPQSCIIDFYTNFEFKSMLYSSLVNIVFDTLVTQMEFAFLAEAKRRYGQPSLHSQILNVKKKS